MENQQIHNEFSKFMETFKQDDVIKKVDENINKKLKCAICKYKINAVDALIANCKCGKKHCLKHRMPESHNCDKISEMSERQRKKLGSDLIKVEASKITLI